MNILEINNLSKSFGSRNAVDGVSFNVKEGEVFGLLGPNGAGKSTTLSLVSGLLNPTAGNITLGGCNMAKESLKGRSYLGIVPQEPALYAGLSARANLKFWGTINNVKKEDLEESVNRVLTIVGLLDRADEPIKKYSGGMKRRLNIAAGLIHNPKLLIMDEPTVGVDPQSRNHIIETVKKFGSVIVRC
ncbi:ABC transporter ATP-binding protein [Natranaerofaba carboxydovora]|uniref:ABC transporter ATP-binding protein n=1 Tax=Natranaerofaba carboxydovora TaxID=2742683 RepID=UPI001F13A8C7|nr:ABC transporter ATP-binding protein [Natranaerofaba carboxydovora]UMZ74069.1 putative ABC transporter ATP-binding protein YxlF [Natranaerofaba carboxydovora]